WRRFWFSLHSAAISLRIQSLMRAAGIVRRKHAHQILTRRKHPVHIAHVLFTTAVSSLAITAYTLVRTFSHRLSSPFGMNRRRLDHQRQLIIRLSSPNN